jgi:hypothetical protein
MSEEARVQRQDESAEGSLGMRQLSALLLAWLIPGAGHFAVGKRARGLLFCAIVIASLLVGCWLQGNLHHIVPDQPLTILATLGSMGMGLPYFVLRWIFEYQGEITQVGYEYGSAFILTAGLMNLLLVLDVWDLLRGRKD